MSKRTRTASPAAVSAFVLERLQDASRAWKTGDDCLSFRGPGVTKVVRVEGEMCFLADGTSGHHTRMRRAVSQ